MDFVMNTISVARLVYAFWFFLRIYTLDIEKTHLLALEGIWIPKPYPQNTPNSPQGRIWKRRDSSGSSL